MSNLLGKWKDIGKGCCSQVDETNVLFSGPLESGSLYACKQKCLQHSNCKYVVHGWNDGYKYCHVIGSDAQCRPLQTGHNDCGDGGGDNGVHSYEFQKGMITLS